VISIFEARRRRAVRLRDQQPARTPDTSAARQDMIGVDRPVLSTGSNISISACAISNGLLMVVMPGAQAHGRASKPITDRVAPISVHVLANITPSATMSLTPITL
jgi:hypothetical protein